MTNDSDSMCSNQSWPIEDDDLRDILQLADIIRANPIYDDTVAVFDSDLMSFFDTQLSAPADPAAAVHPTAAADATDSKPGEIFADNTLMTMLNCCLNPGNNDVQLGETLTKGLDSYISDHQPMRQQPSILQNRWSFTGCESPSYYSAPEDYMPGPRSFYWSQYGDSPPPSSSSSSSSCPSVFNYPNYLCQGFMGHMSSYQHGAAALSTPMPLSRHRRRSSIDGSSISSISSLDDSRQRPVKRRTRTKTNKMKVHHLWEFIRELLDVSEMQQQQQQQQSLGGDAPKQASPVIWQSKENGVFRIVDSKLMAKLWGDHKRNSTMTYEKLSRSLRWCRSSGFLSEIPKNANYPKKLCFRFGPRAADMYVARRQHLLSTASVRL